MKSPAFFWEQTMCSRRYPFPIGWARFRHLGGGSFARLRNRIWSRPCDFESACINFSLYPGRRVSLTGRAFSFPTGPIRIAPQNHRLFYRPVPVYLEFKVGWWRLPFEKYCGLLFLRWGEKQEGWPSPAFWYEARFLQDSPKKIC